MDNEKIFKNELKKAHIESINLWHHMKIRTATINDLDAIAAVEAECFPAAEAADKLISFVDGFVTDQPDLTDEMYENASMHNEKGAWQMIFGVNTLPAYRQHGYAGELIRKAILDAKSHGRKGLVLTCKDKLIHYYASFGFVDEGISESVHGNVVWHQMRLTF